MQFNSFVFIFGFLPLALTLTFVAGRWNQTAAKFVLLASSLVFYAAWRVEQTALLLFSIGFNFIIGSAISRCHASGKLGWVRALLIGGIVVDVAMLGWFKYANFITDNINATFGANLVLARIALPLAISFFTFQKIAYLIDTARGETKPISLLNFSLFAAFFPQLIAGPIVHFREVVPQILSRRFGHLSTRNLMVGLVMFAIGLFKKTVIADTLARYADPLFEAAHRGQAFDAPAAWLAAIAFTIQVYFDFSGYTDMAIGLGRMLDVKLPLNFHSPLRSPDIIEYWRRWHMTLQRFIVAYIFEPLSVPLNRLVAGWGLGRAPAFLIAVGIPVLVTFTTVGLWHGAGWTFILFGVLHAAYILTNQAWRDRVAQVRRRRRRAGAVLREARWPRIVARHGLTLVAVLFANVLFRSRTVGEAAALWRAMVGVGSGSGPAAQVPWGWPLALTVGASAMIIMLAPNTQQIMGRYDPAYNWNEWKNVAAPPIRWTWRPSALGVAFAGAAFFFGVMFIQRGAPTFIYFNF
jgi:D-alanyl-lipoteichoic acid acyltransferase DltB (MBOAT superfamily)